MKIWMDEVSGRINTEERGKYLGAFDTGGQIIVIYKDGAYEINDLDLNKKYDASKIMFIKKWDPEKAVSAIYYDGEKGWVMVKRFLVETTTTDQLFSFISDAGGSKLYFATQNTGPEVKYSFKKGGQKLEELLKLEDFIDVKGWKAMGNKLCEYKLLKVEEVENVDSGDENNSKTDVDAAKNDSDSTDKYNPGDTIELDF
jgi:topoisomerase-4 subunit A